VLRVYGEDPRQVAPMLRGSVAAAVVDPAGAAAEVRVLERELLGELEALTAQNHQLRGELEAARGAGGAGRAEYEEDGREGTGGGYGGDGGDGERRDSREEEEERRVCVALVAGLERMGAAVGAGLARRVSIVGGSDGDGSAATRRRMIDVEALEDDLYTVRAQRAAAAAAAMPR
jgi:hypothetical protein